MDFNESELVTTGLLFRSSEDLEADIINDRDAIDIKRLGLFGEIIEFSSR